MDTPDGSAARLDPLQAGAPARERPTPTAFALRFKAVAGVAPLAYLTAWRMRLAQRALRDEDVNVAELATQLGYASESAFSHAFKREVGVGPRAYRRVERSNK